jgi:hypothetical protein
LTATATATRSIRWNGLLLGRAAHFRLNLTTGAISAISVVPARSPDVGSAELWVVAVAVHVDEIGRFL